MYVVTNYEIILFIHKKMLLLTHFHAKMIYSYSMKTTRQEITSNVTIKFDMQNMASYLM